MQSHSATTQTKLPDFLLPKIYATAFRLGRVPLGLETESVPCTSLAVAQISAKPMPSWLPPLDFFLCSASAAGLPLSPVLHISERHARLPAPFFLCARRAPTDPFYFHCCVSPLSFVLTHSSGQVLAIDLRGCVPAAVALSLAQLSQ
jgi:hypothetical protein